MPIDMIEHEFEGTSLNSLGARNEQNIQTVSSSNLDRNFLIKKMEIEFMIHGGVDVTGATFGPNPSLLVFFHDDGIAADAENSLDAEVMHKEAHNDIIWSRPFSWMPVQTDDTNGHSIDGLHPVFKTSKSFPKGYPLSKEDTYIWKVINVSETLAFANPASEASNVWLRVRYWGVYL